jgi:hypothetical protein
VQIRGGNLVVSAELVNVAEGSQLWGAQYNRKFEDIFSIQEDIATEITAKLRVRLTGAQRKRLSMPQTRSSEAYELYLRGRFFWNMRTPEGIKRGLEHFERAIALDPEFALAHAGLADCYCVMGAGEFGIFPPRQVMPKAQVAAARAVALDDSLAETHSALATVKFWYDWDWSGAEREFQRAILINPGYAAAHAWYGEFLSAMGRFDEALDEARRAAALDPMSVTAMWTLARVLNLAGDHVAAIAEMLKASNEPTFVRPYIPRGPTTGATSSSRSTRRKSVASAATACSKRASPAICMARWDRWLRLERSSRSWPINQPSDTSRPSTSRSCTPASARSTARSSTWRRPSRSGRATWRT